MKNTLFILWLLMIVTQGTTVLEAKRDHTHNHKTRSYHIEDTTPLTQNRIIKVKVDGMVCSFCAYGAEKKLSKLPFVETNAYGRNGVQVDLKSGFVTLSLKEDEKVNFGNIVNAITKGGYVAREIHFTLIGTAHKEGKNIVIQDSQFPYHFIIKESLGEILKKNMIEKTLNVNVFFTIPKTFKDNKEIHVSLLKRDMDINQKPSREP